MALRAFSYVLDALAVTSFWAVTARLLDIEQSTQVYALVNGGKTIPVPVRPEARLSDSFLVRVGLVSASVR
jgi:hypothetical protein